MKQTIFNADSGIKNKNKSTKNHNLLLLSHSWNIEQEIMLF